MDPALGEQSPGGAAWFHSGVGSGSEPGGTLWRLPKLWGRLPERSLGVGRLDVDAAVPGGSVPPVRYHHAAAYSHTQSALVVFGGEVSATSELDDAWILSGGGWSEVTPELTPLPTTNSAMAQMGDEVVLFGGGSGAAANETWRFAGQRWRRLVGTSPPSARLGHDMVYDAARHRIVLFGGGDSVSLADTWEFDGVSWSPMTPTDDPGPRSAHTMAYDSQRGVVVLFGGVDENSNEATGTWEYDGSNWSPVTTTNEPPLRITPGMVYDVQRDVILMYGGLSMATGDLMGDTWEYDGTNWTEVTTAVNPGDRYGHRLAYHAALGRIVLFGGYNFSGFLTDTWEYDGNTWHQTSPPGSPSGRVMLGMSWFPLGRSVLIFGGAADADLGDTWQYRYEFSGTPDELCDNGVDDDGDGVIDCADPDCQGWTCGPGQTCAGGSCR